MLASLGKNVGLKLILDQSVNTASLTPGHCRCRLILQSVNLVEEEALLVSCLLREFKSRRSV